jgi:hypothetical protein
VTGNESSALRFVKDLLAEMKPPLPAVVNVVSYDGRRTVRVVLPGRMVYLAVDTIAFWRDKERVGLAVPGQTKELILEQLQKRSSTV